MISGITGHRVTLSWPEADRSLTAASPDWMSRAERCCLEGEQHSRLGQLFLIEIDPLCRDTLRILHGSAYLHPAGAARN